MLAATHLDLGKHRLLQLSQFLQLIHIIVVVPCTHARRHARPRASTVGAGIITWAAPWAVSFGLDVVVLLARTAAATFAVVGMRWRPFVPDLARHSLGPASCAPAVLAWWGAFQAGLGG